MEKKKIFDVTPPLEREKKEAVFVESEPPQTALAAEKKGSRFKGKAALSVVLLAAGLFFLGRATIHPKAEITIWPIKSQVKLNAEVLVAENPGVSGALQGELIVKEDYFSQDFPATGFKNKEVKAQGTIRVYNNYSTEDQVLLATTRFVSDQGKLFRTPKQVIIPGGRYEGGKFVPGEIDIAVEAGEPGEDYNIGPATFSIPGFAGTPRYTDFYAKSFAPMAGGKKTEAAYVTAEDLALAEKSLSEKALTQNSQNLIGSVVSPDYVLVANAVKGEIVEVDPLAEAGQEKQTFSFRVKARTQGLIFKKESVESFARNYLSGRLAQNQNLDENSLGFSYLAKEVDMAKGTILLNVEISAETYPTIDEQSIKQAVVGQRPDQMTASLRAFLEVEQFQVKLWPFWVSEAPLDSDGISVELKLD